MSALLVSLAAIAMAAALVLGMAAALAMLAIEPEELRRERLRRDRR